MVAPPFYITYYGININCYDLCNVRQPVVYSVEVVEKRGSYLDIDVNCKQLKLVWKGNVINPSIAINDEEHSRGFIYSIQKNDKFSQNFHWSFLPRLHTEADNYRPTTKISMSFKINLLIFLIHPKNHSDLVCSLTLYNGFQCILRELIS